jgi:rubrerythrin
MSDIDKLYKRVQKMLGVPEMSKWMLGSTTNIWEKLYTQQPFKAYQNPEREEYRQNPCAITEMVDEYGNVDIPHINPGSQWAMCNVCDPNNVMFYDKDKHKECPRCKAKREELPEFISESDMEL